MNRPAGYPRGGTTRTPYAVPTRRGALRRWIALIETETDDTITVAFLVPHCWTRRGALRRARREITETTAAPAGPTLDIYLFNRLEDRPSGPTFDVYREDP